MFYITIVLSTFPYLMIVNAKYISFYRLWAGGEKTFNSIRVNNLKRLIKWQTGTVFIPYEYEDVTGV